MYRYGRKDLKNNPSILAAETARVFGHQMLFSKVSLRRLKDFFKTVSIIKSYKAYGRDYDCFQF